MAGPNQIGVAATPVAKRLYKAAQDAGIRAPLLMQAGLLWLLENHEVRQSALARLREIEAQGDAFDASAFIRSLEQRASAAAAAGARAMRAGDASSAAASAPPAKRRRPRRRSAG